MSQEQEVKRVPNKKRPPKRDTVIFLLSMFNLLKSGVTGITHAVTSQQISEGNYFLYENEVQEVIDEKREKDPQFDSEGFVEMLVNADAIDYTERLPFGGRGGSLVRINSPERALEVANNPEDVSKIIELISAIKEIGDQLTPLIDKKAILSVALKNKIPKKREGGEEESDSTTNEVE